MTVTEPLSGLALLRAIVEGERPQPPICRTLGFSLVEATPESVVFEGLPGEHLHNPLGSVHGGFYATLLDSAMGSAVIARLPAGQLATTTQLTTNLVRSVTARTGMLRATGRVVHLGRTVATAEGRLEGADGKLYAHGTTAGIVFTAG